VSWVGCKLPQAAAGVRNRRQSLENEGQLMAELGGKRALITGGARGMGAATARLFVDSGARVIVADVLDKEGEALASELGQAARFVHLDVTSEQSWAAAARFVQDEWGGLDVLVNNAGILRSASLETMSLADFQQVVAVNQVGCFLGMQAAIAPMRAAGGGSIVNLSSVAGLKGVAGVIGYVASKWAIRGMTKTAAMELGHDGIRVNSVHPGAIDTDMSNGPEFQAVDRTAHFGALPVPRIGRPDEVAQLIAFLASDASSYSTGGEFVIDGGGLAGDARARTED
jgi:3alpha(or 20beta)-hydroxysteroid dehydrogenase